MDDALDYTSDLVPSEPTEPADAPQVPVEPADPITSRFLYVDVAALRAKQLRRGARLRYDIEPGLLPLVSTHQNSRSRQANVSSFAKAWSTAIGSIGGRT